MSGESAGVGIWGEGSIAQTSLQTLLSTEVRRELGPRGPPTTAASDPSTTLRGPQGPSRPAPFFP